ncbi:MAG: ankyrin repeat domain-containing protein [Simkaniaceae bacterium]|nr:ankyrin repeat domain-containing protein [Simkaniaceae bacterium]
MTVASSAIGTADSATIGLVFSLSESESESEWDFDRQDVPLFGTAIEIAVWKGHMQTVERQFDRYSVVDLTGEGGRVRKGLRVCPIPRGVVSIEETFFSPESACSAESTFCEGSDTERDDEVVVLLDHLFVRAVLRRHYRVAGFLLDQGADVNGRLFRDTALVEASRRGREEQVSFLLDRGAGADIVGGGGKTPLMVAKRAGHEKVARLLLEKGATKGLSDGRVEGEALMGAVERDERDRVGSLLSSESADVNFFDAEGKTPLMRAVKRGHEEMVLLLLDRGARVNVVPEGRKRKGETPLVLAVKAGKPSVAIVSSLFDYGADLHFANEERGGLTAFDIAVCCRRDEITSLFIDRHPELVVRHEDVHGEAVPAGY